MASRGAYVTDGNPDAEDDGRGWTKVNKKTKEMESRKKRKNTKDEELQERKKAAQAFMESTNVYESTTIYEEFERIQQQANSTQKVTKEKTRKRAKESAQVIPAEGFDLPFVEGVSSVNLNKNKQKKKKKSKESQPSKPRPTKSISECAAGLSVEELNKVIHSASTKYPEDQLIQLKLVADLFDRVFSVYGHDDYEDNEEDSDDEDKPFWATSEGSIAPFSSLRPEVVKKVKEYASTINGKTLTDFTWFLFQNHVQAYEKAKKGDTTNSGVGIYVLFQVILMSFPSLGLHILPLVKAKFLTKPKTKAIPTNIPSATPSTFFVLQKDVSSHVVLHHLFGVLIHANPKVAIYCWLEVLLPSFIEYLSSAAPALSSWESETCSVILTYIELLHNLYSNKAKFKGPPSTLVGISGVASDSPAGLILFLHLVHLLGANQITKKGIKEKYNAKIQDSLNKTVQMLIFIKENSPHVYFPSFFQNYSYKPVPKAGTEEDESEPSIQNLELKLLSLCLIQDPQSIQELTKLYVNYIRQSNNLALYLARHWSTLVDPQKMPHRLPPKTVQQNVSALDAAVKNFCTINDALLSNSYKNAEGRQIGFKSLGIDRETVETANASCYLLLKKINNTVVPGAPKKSGFLSSFLKFLFFLLLIVVVIAVLLEYKKIPQHWVEEVAQYIPKPVQDQIVLARKQLGSQLGF